LEESAQRVQAMHDAAKRINPRILVLCHGGPIAEPADAQYILEHTEGIVGFYGASSMERLPVEPAIANRVRELNKQPSEYFGTNILVTTSGVASLAPMLCSVSSIGEENVMFSIDYPFEDSAIACKFIDTAAISEDLRAKICHGNAVKKLRLPV